MNTSFSSRKSAANSVNPASNPLPDRITMVLQETRWLFLLGVGGFLATALFGFNLADPGWSHSKAVANIANPAGHFGAWIADLLLYVFGFSAWWWVALCFALIASGYKRLDGFRSKDRRPLIIALLGFLLLLVASAGLEALRFYSVIPELPRDAGGVLGYETARFAKHYLGGIGATMMLITGFTIGFSLFTGFSWFKLIERIGAVLEFSVSGFFYLRDFLQDKKIGREKTKEREIVVQEEKIRHQNDEPIFIEMPKTPEPVPVKVEQRIEKERQTALFPEIIAGGLLPPLHLLEPAPPQTERVSPETLEFTSRLIERKLADFGIVVKVVAAYPGPVITRYEIEPAVGVKGAQIVNLAKDVARALSLVSIRVVETVPGKSCMALELPNAKRQTVRISEIIESAAYSNMNSPLAMALGKDIGGNPCVLDLAKMPHLLVAGTTGSGKSVGINAMILSLLYKSEPSEVRLILVDPKMLELSIYEGIPHLLAPVVTDMKLASNALNWCIGEMEKRYKLMANVGVRNLAGLNQRIREGQKTGEKLLNPFSLTPESPEPLETLPAIVVVIDELADMMMVVGKKVEQLIARLAQKARAAGIHLILATQRPSVDVITGLIKANIPTRMSFQVSSKIDSRTILDQMGAEALLGQGDMLYLAPGTGYPTRVHGAFVDDNEVHRVVNYLKAAAPPAYIEDVLNTPAADEEGASEGTENSNDKDAEADPLYDQAVEVVLKNKRASISLVQRHLRIGYNRAARIIEGMEKAGLVSGMDERGGRSVISRNAEGN